MMLSFLHNATPRRKDKKLLAPQEAALRIQNFIRMKQATKLKQILKNRRNYRKNIKKELLLTEEYFVSDLSLLIKNCYEPLLEATKSVNPIITLEDLENIFANIVEVRDAGKQFLDLLSEAIHVNDHYSKFGSVFTTFASGFKTYYPYTANYQRAQKFLDAERQQNPLLEAFLQELEFTEKLKEMDIFSFLIKPIQRLTKYPLILDSLVAYTDIEHPDYKDIKEAQALTRTLNEENNMYIEHYTKNLRQIELQETYGNPLEVSIYHPGRHLILEEVVYSTKDKLGQAHNLFILSDMVVYSPQLHLTEDHQGKLKPAQRNHANYIRLNDASLIKDISDGKYFSNLFSIVGINRVETFSVKDLETKQRIISTLDSALQELKKASVLSDLKQLNISEQMSYVTKQIEVHALGSEERPNGFNTYTYYIILITLGSKYRKVFKTYGNFFDLSQQLQSEFPNKKLLFLSRDLEIIKSHRSKTIERRKFAIENFLQHAFQDRDIRFSAHVSNFFKFPKNFFEEERVSGINESQKIRKVKTSIVTLEETYARISSLSMRRRSHEHRKSSAYRLSLDLNTAEETPAVRNSFVFEEINDSKEVFKMVDADTLSQKHLSMSSGRERFGSFGKHATLPKHMIDVFLIDGTRFSYGINERTTAGEICDLISEQLHLKVNDDFRLFLTESEQLERGLDDNELIAEAIYIDNELKANLRNSVWCKLKRKFLDAFRNRPSKLVFKKFYYQCKEEEVRQYKNDYIRLKLLVAQALDEVKKLRYDLDYKEYILLATLAACEKYQDEIKLIGQSNWYKKAKQKNLFLEFIPEKVFETRNEIYWNNAFESCWKKLAPRIEATVQSNIEFFEEKKSADSKVNSFNSLESIFNSVASADRIVKLLIMNIMWSKKTYGMALYEAKVKYPSQKITQSGWPREKFLFGISHDKIQAISLNRSKTYATIKLKEIANMKCYPVSLVITLNGGDMIRLDSKRSFEIYQLIKIYQQLEEFYSKEHK